MNNQERKRKILGVLKQDNCDNIYEILNRLGPEINALEAIPFGSRNELIRIVEDLADGKGTQKSSMDRLIKIVESVPD